MRRALEDSAVMGRAFAGDSWLPWRSLLIAANGEELSTRERSVFTELTGRPKEPLERVEELVTIKGRRSGGTSAAGAMLVYNAALVDYSDCLGRGEKALALCLAPNARQAQIAFDRTAGLIDDSEMLRSMVLTRTQDTISLANSVNIEVRPASFRGLRGVTCCAVCLDESAFFLFEGQGSNTDTEILNSLRPSLITTRGMLMVSSTPYSEEGATYNLFRDHYGPDGDPRILVSRSTSRQTNATLPQSVIDRALQRDPAVARSEYLGEWRVDISSFIERAVIERCIDRGITSRPHDSRWQYFCFADVASGIASGGDGDRYAWSIGHREGEQIVLDFATERKPPFDASAVTAELAATCRTYRVHEVTADRFAHGFFSSELSKHGLVYRPADRDRSRLYLDSLPQLASPGRVKLLDLAAIPEQYSLLERKVGVNGHDRVDARGNRHEDLANTISAIVAMLSGAQSSGDNWCEYYRRLNEQAGLSFSRMNTDFDGIRAAGDQFGWNLRNDSEPLFLVWWPDPLVRGESDISYQEGRPCKRCTRREAQSYLRHPPIAALNPELAELLEDK
jgi:hypothetical protein